ncbi:DUF4293 family protein [Dysgonomonas sp. 521]|uniref:DUF4293 domain-containing protein n=1 Tax=Dysgonomonas sp. 521 TaxID=2302932 RepID=UPI0013D562A5|nr:DUF4293 domain-containing protein [Dysgonomonas sp. 521]NDV97010.1 DUF4293 family protein [Dysgonomonas sp. 521]
MIQRIQTIFLLLTAILMGGTFRLPSLKISSEGLKFASISFDSFGMFDAATDYPTWGVAVFAVLSAILAFVNIFLYKKRKLQINLGLLTALLIVVYFVTAMVYLNTFLSKISAEYTLNLQLGIILPVAALIFDFLAVSRIRKDEKLVRSLNRIR